MEKEPIEVKGSLDRYRDFLFVEDNVEILYKSLNLKGSHNKSTIYRVEKKL